MRKLLKITLTLFIIITIVLGFALPLNMPPGWYQQTLPVNDLVNDIFFIDTSNGWLITLGDNNGADTAYVMRTTNGGNNWNIQYTITNELTTIQFLDISTGYIAGGTGSGTGRVFKTTNAGINWNIIFTSGQLFDDMFFIGKDTGWICDNDSFIGAGIQKTTNGGLSWFQQLPRSFQPSKLFFINKDTGWAACNLIQLYRTTNGGTNWNIQHTYSSSDNIIRGIFFINGNTGWTTHQSGNDSSSIYKSTNSGVNWIRQRDPDPFSSGVSEVFFINPTTGYIATAFSKILKTTNGGTNWNSQNGPSGGYTEVQFVDSNIGWAAANTVIHTTDGGGPPIGIQQINNENPI